ncbi:MAG: DNA sulfur modification protein DndD [Candidatus Methanofastidiosia archaeon]|jgi:DNA sulfur modification protein DndD
MKIRNITLCNFKSFRGKYTIDLSIENDKQKNIILFGGANGAGKTTILEAVKLCMYGKRFNGNILSKKKYERYLVSTKNRLSEKENDNSFFIELDIEVDDVYSPYSIILKREFRINNEKLVKETFAIFREGMALEIVPRECWEDYIVSLFPPYIMEYFFFDGERIKELATGDNAEKTLKEAIRDLVGLKLYETLSSDIDSLMRKIKRKNINIPELEKKIEKKDRNILQIEREIKEIIKRIKINKQSIKELNEKKDSTEANLRRKAGSLAKKRKKYEKNLLKLNEELKNLDDEIKEICGETLPFIISYDVCEDLLQQLKKERHLKELMASKNILKEVSQKLIERIRSSEALSLSEKHLLDVEKVVENTFTEMVEELDNESGIILHDLPNIQMNRIENFLNNMEEKIERDMQKNLKRREKILLQSKKVKSALKKISDESFVKDFIDELSTIKKDIKVLENEIETLQNSQEALIEKKEKENKERIKLEDKIFCIYEETRKIEVCEKVKNAINEFIDTSITLRIEELEKLITKLYRRLSNKEDMVKQIKIDSKDLSTTLMGFEDEIVNKENISAGEKEVYALSVLWGLSKISYRGFPLIVDSLLARLDKTHAENIVETFFPKAAGQVIVLAHDREIDKRLYDKMSPYICKEYTLLLENGKKIVQGYFR